MTSHRSEQAERPLRVDCGGLREARWTSVIVTLPTRDVRASAAVGGKADPGQATLNKLDL